jgi:hypothetical protein
MMLKRFFNVAFAPENDGGGHFAMNGDGDGSLTDAMLAMPDIEELEALGERDFSNPESASNRDTNGRFKGREPEPEKSKAPELSAEEKAKLDAKSNSKAKVEPAPADDDEDPLVEFPSDEDGKEPIREKLSAVWDGYQNSKKLSAEIETLRRQTAPDEIVGKLQEIEKARDQVVKELKFLKTLPMPQAPSLSLTDPTSPSFDLNRWNTELAAYQQAKGRADQIEAMRKAHEEQLATEQRTLTLEQTRREAAKLVTAWPEAKDPETMKSFVSNAKKEFGLTDEDLSQISDHKHFLILRDALAYRAAKVTQAEAVKKVMAKPRLVSSPARTTNPKGRGSAEGYARLQASGTVEDAADALEGLL